MSTITYDGTLANGTGYIVRLYQSNAKYQLVCDTLDTMKPNYLKAVSEGNVTSYSLGTRSVSRSGLSASEMMAKYEELLNKKLSMEQGGKGRKAVGVVPRDW